MLFKRKKKMIPPYKRTADEEPFEVYEITKRSHEKKRTYKRSQFVSPIFGKNVKDEVVIPIKTNFSRNMDKMDVFRTKPRITKEERIRKYGSDYPEFDLVRGKNLDEVMQSSQTKKADNKIVEATIIDRKADEPSSMQSDSHDHDNQNGTERKTTMYDFLRDDQTTQRPKQRKPETDESTEKSDAVESSFEAEAKPFEEPQQTPDSSEVKQTPSANAQTVDKSKQTVKTGDNMYKHYQIPPVSLLSKPDEEPVDLSVSVESQTNTINETFNEFGIGARVYKHTQGPTVTRYEIAVEKGVKLSKITNLNDNLKMALGAKDIRIEAPIPGKTTVGIEVPNEEAQTVHFIDIVNRSMFMQAAMPLTIALGLDIDGKPIYAPIKSMPHGLIAGATGSGKSVCINTILMSLLLRYKPSDLKLMLIDPKMVELSAYNDLPHLITPVINDAKTATAALNWVVDEMERRFQTFRQYTARDIDAYNNKIDNPEDKMPYIVIIVDELNDLMMVSSQYVEESIMRITQKARACGIHLIVATQRPSTDVIKGTIKSNIPTRIAFNVSSHIDSQTIIDAAGAETLLGKGDMLYVPTSGNKQRLQGAFVSDEDIETVTNFIKKQAKPDFLFSEEALVKSATKTFEQDDLLEEVAKFVVSKQEASINKISKSFNIGFNRAQSIVESLEAMAVVSGNLGSKAREVLVNEEQLEHILNDMD